MDQMNRSRILHVKRWPAIVTETVKQTAIARGSTMNLSSKRSARYMLQAYVCLFAAIPSILASETLIENDYPTADPFLGEALQQDEAEHARALLDVITKKIQADYYPGIAKRDEHTKAHGCVDATFSVLGDLPDVLRQGLFSNPKDFKSTLRFSNSSANSQADDKERDGRGLAIKLFGVDGEKIDDIPGSADQQDFVLLSVPFFFTNSAKDYTKVIDVKDNGTKIQEVEVAETIGLKGAENIATFFASSNIGSPLEQRYYSAVPYRLGADEKRVAVKYSVKQCVETKTPVPENPTRNYLRDALVETLDKGDACLDFMVQTKIGDGMSVEDSISEWSEEVSPFVTVAKIKIAKQTFNTSKKNMECEQLSFDPWNSVHPHKPIGSINRIRWVVYRGISALRQQMNEQ